ncbi:MAG: PAS domain-containing protein [Chitinophagaceae bacterium]|nr:PAS domain-containing protein [Chitinophagaceae bacterium]
MKILILEDSPEDAELIRRLLKKELTNTEFQLAGDRPSFLKAMDKFEPDVILADNSLPQFDASEALRLVRHDYGNIPFILVTGTVSEEFAAIIIKSGADDYILKDRMGRLPAAIEAAIKQRESDREKDLALQHLFLSEVKFRTMIERITEGFISYDQNWVITYVNKVAEKMFNRPTGYLLGKNIWEEFPQSVGTPIYKAYLKAMESQRNVSIEDFSYSVGAWVDAHIYPSASGVSVYFKDITEKKKADERIRLLNERFSTFSMVAEEAIWDWSFEGHDIWWSESFYKYFDFENGSISPTREDFLAKLHPDDAPLVVQHIAEMVSGEKRHECYHEVRYIRKDNTWGTMDLRCFAIQNKEGKVHRIIGSFSDITERKKLETQLLEQRRMEQMHITSTALEASEKERTAIGRELHDNVNQILASTNLLLNLVKEDPVTHTQFLEKCMNNIREAISENRKIAHHLVTPDLVQESIVTQLDALFESMLGIAGIHVSTNTGKFREEWLSSSQKLAIYRVVQEQCTNITKYAKATRVTCKLETEKGYFNMNLTDNGQGMDEKKLNQGIGLKNIAGRISIFNGNMNISSKPGKGFSLTITFPLDTSKEGLFL